MWKERKFDWVKVLTPGLQMTVVWQDEGGYAPLWNGYRIKTGLFATLEEAQREAERVAKDQLERALKALGPEERRIGERRKCERCGERPCGCQYGHKATGVQRTMPKRGPDRRKAK